MKISDPESKKMSRRDFISWLVMGGTLAASYGLLTIYGLDFLYPRSRKVQQKLFIATQDEILPDKPLTWSAPGGQKVLINNIDGEFKALSNICPHLGCKVHWDNVKSEFFCPCHAGTFDKNGNPTSGPPKAENKRLKQFEVQVIQGAVYLQWEGV